MNIRLFNARILTMETDRPIFWGEVWVKNDKIANVLDHATAHVPKESWDFQLDCKGNLLMPGFKNAHTHSAMTFLRSYADDVPLHQWLHEKVFPLEAKLTGEDVYTLTKLAVLEYLTSGITSIFDMYMFPDKIAMACMDMGMRCVLVSGLNNFGPAIEQVEADYLKWNRKDSNGRKEAFGARHSLISYQLGFHAEYTCSKELLTQISDMVHRLRTPVYTHISETKEETDGCRERYGMSTVAFLDSLGIFDYGGGGYHCVHLSEEDMKIFRKKHMYVITNPGSNTKLASGIAPISDYERHKIPVAIGTDGPASNNCLDMFREMFLVSGLSKLREQDAASMEAMKVLNMATVQGAKAMRLNNADVLAKGKLADIIMIDLQQPNMQPIHNIAKNLVYSGSKTNVCMTMIDGRILYRDGEFHVGESIGSIYAQCEEIVKRIAYE